MVKALAFTVIRRNLSTFFVTKAHLLELACQQMKRTCGNEKNGVQCWGPEN